jgi:hypothetical protein
MDYYYNFSKKQRISTKQKPKRIYAKHRYIRDKILIRFPIIYSLLIEDEYKDIVEDKTDFIIQAVEEKFERDKINFEPREPIGKDFWKKEVDEWK